MGGGLRLERFDSAALTNFLGGLLGLTAVSLNGGANSFGFHGVYMGFFFGGLYRRKLGCFPSVVSVSFPDPLTATKSGTKAVNLCKAVFTCLSAVPFHG